MQVSGKNPNRPTKAPTPTPGPDAIHHVKLTDLSPHKVLQRIGATKSRPNGGALGEIALGVRSKEALAANDQEEMVLTSSKPDGIDQRQRLLHDAMDSNQIHGRREHAHPIVDSNFQPFSFSPDGAPKKAKAQPKEVQRTTPPPPPTTTPIHLGGFRLDVLQEQNAEMKKQLELQGKRLATIEAQLRQAKASLKLTTESYRRAQAKNQSLAMRLKLQEEEEAAAREPPKPVEAEFNADDLERQMRREAEEEAKRDEALRVANEQLENEAQLVRRTLGFGDSITYSNIIESRSFSELRRMFMACIAKLQQAHLDAKMASAAFIKETQSMIVSEKSRDVDSSPSSPTIQPRRVSTANPARRKSSVAPGSQLASKRETEELHRRLFAAKQLAAEQTSCITKLGTLAAQLGKIGISSTHSIVAINRRIRDCILQKGGKKSVADIDEVLMDSLDAVSSYLDGFRPLGRAVEATLQQFSLPFEGFEDRIVPCRVAANEERERPLKSVKDDETALKVYMEEVNDYRERLRAAQNRSSAVGTQTDAQKKSAQERAAALAMRGVEESSDGDADEVKTPSLHDTPLPNEQSLTSERTPLGELTPSSGRGGLRSPRSVQTLYSHRPGEVPDILRRLIECAAMISSCSLQILFGPASAQSTVAPEDALQQPTVNLNALRRKLLSDANHFPLSIDAADIQGLSACRQECLLLLDICALWRQAMPCHVHHCSNFVDIVRRNPAIALDRYHNDRQLAAQQLVESTGGRFTSFLATVTKNGSFTTIQEITDSLRALNRLDKAEARLNWKGLVRLHNFVLLREQVKEGIRELKADLDEGKDIDAERNAMEQWQQSQQERWQTVRGHQRLCREALWGEVLQSLQKEEDSVKASGIDLELLDGVGPAASKLMIAALHSFFEKSPSHRIQQIKESPSMGLPSPASVPSASPVAKRALHSPIWRAARAGEPQKRPGSPSVVRASPERKRENHIFTGYDEVSAALRIDTPATL